MLGNMLRQIVFVLGIQIASGQIARILSASQFRYTTFQEGVICNAAQKPATPTNLSELQNLVIAALRNNQNVKANGRRHSGTDIICTDGIPVEMLGINHFRYDSITKLATVGAGTSLGTFLRHLHDRGRTVYGLPSYLDITIGGALGTGAHGTSIRYPATVSDQIVGIVMVDGLGNIRNITDREALKAFKTHLGLLGIVYEVTFTTQPQYKFHIRNYPQPDNVLWKGEEIMRVAMSNERFQFFWFPTANTVVMSVGNRVPLNTTGNCQTYFVSEGPRSMTEPLSEALERMQEGMDHLGFFTIQSLAKLSLYQKVPGRSPIFTTNGKTFCEPAIGYSHQMLANRCVECPWQHGNASVFEFEFAVIIPLSELQGSLNTMRELLQEYPMELPLTGMLFRFLPPSDGLMAINSDRPSVAIEWVLVPRKERFKNAMLGISVSQAMVQALITKHNGRSHWGKNGPVYTQKPLLLERYPHLPTFIRWMQEYDPHGIFLNDFGRRLRFGSTKSSIDSYAPYCALVDGCICQTDKDCGDGSPGSYLCDTLQNYRVCKESPGEYDAFRGKIVRKLVSTLKQ